MSLNLHVISAFSIIAPILVGAICFRSLSFTIRLLFVFVLVTGVMEFTSGWMMAHKINNLALFHLHVYVEFTAITALFFLTYDSVLWRGIALSFFGLFLSYSLVNTLFYEDLYRFNSNQRYVEGLMIIVMCVGYFISLLRRPIHRYLEKQPMFWLTSGFLIYFAGTLYLFLFSRELLAINDYQYWEIHAVLNIGLNIIYVVAFLKERKL